MKKMKESVNPMKVVVVVGTRPEIIRLSRVMVKLDQYMKMVLIHTGQNYDFELNQVFFKNLGLPKPDHFLKAAGDTPAETIGQVIAAVDPVLALEKPDAILVLGDTNSCLATLPAKRRRIPVFHMEAGNRCFDHRVPEEINRRIVDHISDINMPYSDIAREYLLREGLPPDRIIKTGSPMFEVINYHMEHIRASDALSGLNLEPGRYFVVSAHREENVDDKDRLNKLVNVLEAVTSCYDFPVIMSTHPRTRNRLERHGLTLPEAVQPIKPLGFFDYIRLQLDAFAVLSDSGTISEEASILNFPALNIRDAHERPEAMEEAAVMMTGLSPKRVLQGLSIIKDQPRGESCRLLQEVTDYTMPNVSDKVLRIIQGYTDYVARTVYGYNT